MLRLTSETAAAVGRMTIAATDLEYLLAWIGADQAGGDADAVFARPGEPLAAARGSVQFAPPAYRQEFIDLVEGAGTQLARGQATLRALWYAEARADPARFDQVATDLVGCRDALRALLDASGVAPDSGSPPQGHALDHA